ncbi:Serine carboxypeptidase-like protein 40 [Cinnamomum micranthum f. kanehirae]|uniref:Serine carboxypeptidase-like protein 40 n=1 Tax=Cinnamomum micranthum f. kanehirae TaxID=337451 RepID=A0A3S3N0T0_9MAGN|nr:Serine carboxypeptidase-like protein 40 [Cinnamomum micranthum f. kanehirae]
MSVCVFGMCQNSGLPWNDSPTTILPIIQQLMASNIRVWIYSGDVDSAVSVTSTRYSINTMNLSIETPWYPWYAQQEVGGYAVGYQGLAFVTVRFSGHFVPSYQPARALTMFSSFIQGAQRANVGLTDTSDWSFELHSQDVYVGPQDGSMEADKITELPGQPNNGVSFDQYSGYVTVESWTPYMEGHSSITSPSLLRMPLLNLWCCGSMEVFLISHWSLVGGGTKEDILHYPRRRIINCLIEVIFFYVTVANIIFLESPAGVGFSYSNTTSDFELSGDNRTAQDSLTFLVNWLERFPQYKNRDFYITGESYRLCASACIHHPSIQQNHQPDSNQSTRNCGAPDSLACDNYQNQADDAIGDVHGYNIYAPYCTSPPSPNPYLPSLIDCGEQDVGFDPCSDNYIHSYLNLPQVQKALHANVTGIEDHSYILAFPFIELCLIKIDSFVVGLYAYA